MIHADLPDPQPPPAAQQLADHLGQHLKRYQSYVNAYVRHEMLEDMDDLNLTFRQVGLMFHLRERGVQNVSALADAVRLTVPATSHLIERLVQRGLLERGENPENRRQKQVALTGAGQQFLGRIEDGTLRAYTALLGGVPLPVLEDLERCLTRLDAHLPPDPSTFVCRPLASGHPSPESPSETPPVPTPDALEKQP